MPQGQPAIEERSTVVVIDPLVLRRAGLVALMEDWARKSGLTLLGLPSISPLLPGSVADQCLAIFNLGETSFQRPDLRQSFLEHRTLYPDVPGVIVSDLEDVDQIVAAFRAGAKGYIVTSTEPMIALNAFALIIAGGSFFPPAALAPRSRGTGRQRGGNGTGRDRKSVV